MSAPLVRPALGRNGSGSSSSEYASYSLCRGPLLGPSGEPSLARMRSVDHLNAGVPPHRRRPPTLSSAKHTAADDAQPAGCSPLRARCESECDAPAAALVAFDPFHESFDELAISHAAKSAADFAATLLAFREADWTINRTSELPSAMLSEQRVLGAPGGLAAPDRYHRAPRWQLSPASVLHHLPPDTRRQEVSALRDLCRARKRERDELEAQRFEDRLKEKQRRKQQRDEHKRRLELEAEEEYRRKEREKRKQRKKGGSSTRDNSVSASYRSGAGGHADVAALLSAATAHAAIHGQTTVAQLLLHDDYRGEEDHSALVMHDQPTADRMQADIVAALPDDAPLCTACLPRAPCHLFTMQSYSCTAPLHPAGLTALELSIAGRNASASTLCVALTSNAPQHVFFRPPILFVFAHSTVDIGVDYVGDFSSECVSLPSVEASSTGVPVASPHALTVSIRILSRDDIANGFSTVDPSLYWEYAENQERQSRAAEKIVQSASAVPSSAAVVATAEARTAAYKAHSYSIPVRWVRGDGSQNNLAGSMPAQYALLAAVARKEQPTSPTPTAAAAVDAQSPLSPLTPPPAVSGGVRFLTPSMDPLRTPLFPGGVSPGSSAVPAASPSLREFGSDSSYLILDQLQRPLPLAAPLSPSQQPPAEFEQVVASLRAQMAEHQRQIVALQSMTTVPAAGPADSEASSQQLTLPAVLPASAAGGPVKRVRSAKAKTMLSMSDMRQPLAASVDPAASLSVPCTVSGSGLLVPVPLPNLEGRAAGVDSRRQSRRRSRMVHADGAAGVKSTAPPSPSPSPADTTGAEAGTRLDETATASHDFAAADDDIKAQRIARRQTLNQVDARRRDGDDADPHADPRPMESSAAAALLLRAEEDMRAFSSAHSPALAADSTPVSASTPVPASAPVAAAPSSLSPLLSPAAPPPESMPPPRVLHHSAQTALTWLDERSLAPISTDGGDNERAVASVAAAAPAAAASAGQGQVVSSSVRDRWQRHLRSPSPSPAGTDVRSLLVEWEAQLQLAEHRRAEQLHRLGAMRRSVASDSGSVSTHLRSRLLYLRSELSALDDERATLMACELDIRGEARACGLDIDGDSAATPRTTAPLSPPSLVAIPPTAALSPGRADSVLASYARLRDRMLRLEVLRAHHRLLLSTELSELRATERVASARSERVWINELITDTLEPPRAAPQADAFFRTSTAAATAAAAAAAASASGDLHARIPAYLSATGSLIRSPPPPRMIAGHASLDHLYGTSSPVQRVVTPTKHTASSTGSMRSADRREQLAPIRGGAGRPVRSRTPGYNAKRDAHTHTLRPASAQQQQQQRQPRVVSPAAAAAAGALSSNPYQRSIPSLRVCAEQSAHSSSPSAYQPTH